MHPVDVMLAAHELGIERSQVIDGLIALGYRLAPDSGVPYRLTRKSLILLSVELNGRAPWWNRGDPIGAARLHRIQLRLKLPRRAIARMLRDLGLTVNY